MTTNGKSSFDERQVGRAQIVKIPIDIAFYRENCIAQINETGKNVN